MTIPDVYLYVCVTRIITTTSRKVLEFLRTLDVLRENYTFRYFERK